MAFQLVRGIRTLARECAVIYALQATMFKKHHSFSAMLAYLRVLHANIKASEGRYVIKLLNRRLAAFFSQ